MKNRKPTEIENNSSFAFFFLLLYSIAIFLRPQEWSLAIAEYPIARYMLILAFFGYLLFQKPKIWGPPGWLLIALLLTIILSGLRNGSFENAYYEAYTFCLYNLLPFILFSGLVNTQRRNIWVFMIIIFATTVMVQHGYTQVNDIDGLGWAGSQTIGGRITYLGFFKDPNDLGTIFLMTIPLLVYLTHLSKSKVLKLTYFTLICILLYGIMLTNSRGALLGFLSLMITYFYLRYGKIKTFLLLLASLPIVLILMSKFRSIDSKEESAYGRIEAWYEGIQMLKFRPLFGVGRSNFTEHHILTAHNSEVQIMAELGIIGYSLWFVLIALTVFMLFKIFSTDKKEYEDQPEVLSDILLAKCLFFSFVAFIVTALFLSHAYSIYLYVYIGLSWALYYRTIKANPELTIANFSVLIRNLFLIAFSSLFGLYVIITILQ